MNEQKKRPLVMGIINATPDSFFPGSRKDRPEAGVEAALAMEAAGADILDIGGESSRPGAEYVGEEEELRRVVPLIRRIREVSRIRISVDTRKAQVARAALDAGADIINDISALEDDPLLAGLAAERGVPVVLMHKRGIPSRMQENPRYGDTMGEICAELQPAVDRALAAGIQGSNIILDPGIGFGKRPEDNLAILREIPRLKALGYPVLIGASRKAFIGLVLDKPVEERMLGSVIVHYHAALLGADILRVHDVAETVQAVKLWEVLAEDPARYIP